jgi:hypothetical protein
MCDEQGSSLQRILWSLKTRVPKIMLQRVEEIYPLLKERLVSVWHLC